MFLITFVLSIPPSFAMISLGSASLMGLSVDGVAPLTDRLLARLHEKHYSHYAVMMWVVGLKVLRPDKFR